MTSRFLILSMIDPSRSSLDHVRLWAKTWSRYGSLVIQLNSTTRLVADAPDFEADHVLKACDVRFVHYNVQNKTLKNYSAARNNLIAAIKKSELSGIHLWIDIDEYPYGLDFDKKLESLSYLGQSSSARITRFDSLRGHQTPLVRVINPSREDDYHFEGIIHEGTVGVPGALIDTPLLNIIHMRSESIRGYKILKYIELCEYEYMKKPNSYWWYLVIMNAQLLNWRKAIVYFESQRHDLSMANTCVYHYVASLLASNMKVPECYEFLIDKVTRPPQIKRTPLVEFDLVHSGENYTSEQFLNLPFYRQLEMSMIQYDEDKYIKKLESWLQLAGDKNACNSV